MVYQTNHCNIKYSLIFLPFVEINKAKIKECNTLEALRRSCNRFSNQFSLFQRSIFSSKLTRTKIEWWENFHFPPFTLYLTHLHTSILPIYFTFLSSGQKSGSSRCIFHLKLSISISTNFDDILQAFYLNAQNELTLIIEYGMIYYAHS